jgi:hypothetical protein
VAEINGLLNRRTALKLYRGFESLPHRKNYKSPQPLRLFILNLVLKAVPPQADRIPPSPEKLEIATTTAIVYFKFRFSKLFRLRRIESLPHRILRSQMN